MIDIGTGIAKILKIEGIDWVSTFPVCKVNNAFGKEKLPMVMMRDDRYAVALADGFSRVTSGKQIGVCTVQGGVNAAGLQVAYAGLAQAYEDMMGAEFFDEDPAMFTGRSTRDEWIAQVTIASMELEATVEDAIKQAIAGNESMLHDGQFKRG